MSRRRDQALIGKVFLRGEIVCRTGLHIGAPRDNVEVGGLEAPVVRDPLTREPYVPGSSLKGKLRALLERRLGLPGNRMVGQEVRRHECLDTACPLCRLFGAASERGGGDNLPARLLFRDGRLTDTAREGLAGLESGLLYTEWKFENSLDRVTAASTPRQLERVPRDAAFAFEIVYSVESRDARELTTDLLHLLESLALLQDDYLGGHGSRGSGQVSVTVKEMTGRASGFYGARAPEERARQEFAAPAASLDDCFAQVGAVADFFSGLRAPAAVATPEPAPAAEAPTEPPADANTEEENP